MHIISKQTADIVTHTPSPSHTGSPGVWCFFMLFFHTNNWALWSRSGCWMVTKSVRFREDLTGACGCCVWWPVWGCAASFPATTLWNIPWSRAEVQRNRKPYTATFAECLLHCLIFGHRMIYTSDFVVLHVDQLSLWNKSATHQELVCIQHAAFVLS